MKKTEELLKKLRKGIPVDDVPQLLDEVRREEALEKAPKKNLFQFEDKRMQHFSDLWFFQRKTATVKQKNRVGLAYISKALGLGDRTAQRFAQGDVAAYHIVGNIQSALPCLNLRSFWQEIKEIFPGFYTDDDVEFLASFTIEAVLHFKWQLEVLFAEDSPILSSLAVNAHAYK